MEFRQCAYRDILFFSARYMLRSVNRTDKKVMDATTNEHELKGGDLHTGRRTLFEVEVNVHHYRGALKI